MPFTLSHAMFAAPLKYIKPKYLSTTGLILGSMSPDFEYFIMLEPYRSIGHSIAGLFLQALPLSIIIAYLVHHLIKVPLSLHITSRYNLSSRLYQFMHQENLDTVRSWIVLIMSIVIGFGTHIVIDGFTHAHGYFVNLLPALNDVLFMSMPTYKALQYSTSILGLIFIVCMIGYYLFVSNPTQQNGTSIMRKQKAMYWLSVTLTACLVTILKLLMSSSHNVLGIMFVAPISGVFLGLIVASLIWKIRVRYF